MKSRMFFSVLLVLVLIATGCDSRKTYSPVDHSEESLVLGVYTGCPSSLIWIAEKKGYFVENKLKIQIKEYGYGVEAVEDMLAGKVDIATASDFVVAKYIMSNSDIRILASLSQNDGVRLVEKESGHSAAYGPET